VEELRASCAGGELIAAGYPQELSFAVDKIRASKIPKDEMKAVSIKHRSNASSISNCSAFLRA
jgi:hypothetical protein